MPHLRRSVLLALAALSLAAAAQQPAASRPVPALDLTSLDLTADPCNDFYQYACGNFAAHHPIPADQTGVSPGRLAHDAIALQLSQILTQASAATPTRTPNQQKIGDFYAACTNTSLIEKKDLAPIQPLLSEIDRVSKFGIPYLTGELQRFGVNAFFAFGEEQDFKNSARQVAVVDQGGLGLPERDYYTRTGEKDVQLRTQYLEYITNILSFSGESPQQALLDARNVLAFETRLAEASMTVTARHDPAVRYHPQTLADFESSLKLVPFKPFLEAVHAPAIDSVINGNPAFFPAMVDAVLGASIQTLHAYLRFHLVDAYAEQLPQRIASERFKFYGTALQGQPQPRPRPIRCTAQVDASLGEALGQVYVEQYFAGDNKARTQQMVADIEHAMDADIDTIDWMGPETKTRAREKLHTVANKIGYPDHWRDYTRLSIAPDEAFGNQLRANAFDNDRDLARIGQPVDRLEWHMTPPTTDAYYSRSMNDINFPAGILQALLDPDGDLALNYGHVGSIVGHELTHGFDDQGRKFDASGNLTDWWTPEDRQKFEQRTSCLVKEYGSFTAVPDPNPANAVKVNGTLTLGENTADNGGLVLAFMAYLDRARKDGLDTAAKLDGYTGPQRFYLGFAQDWCENARPERLRQQVLTDPHSPRALRVKGSIVNQPGFANAFSCKKGSPMVPVDSCRVW